MANEEGIKQELIKQFGFLEGKIACPRPRRIFVEVGVDRFREVFEFAAGRMRFLHLCTITGLDEGEFLSFVYHLAHDEGVLLNIKISVPKDRPVIKTVTPVFPGAEIYEREVMDLLGAKVEGLAPGFRYPMPDDFPADQFPLRKDWKPQP
jgi:membrane-bound hydrogenase subunit beta